MQELVDSLERPRRVLVMVKAGAPVDSVIEQLVPLGPLHNPAHLKGIEVGRELLADVPHVAVFDTGFFAELPPEVELHRVALP